MSSSMRIFKNCFTKRVDMLWYKLSFVNLSNSRWILVIHVYPGIFRYQTIVLQDCVILGKQENSDFIWVQFLMKLATTVCQIVVQQCIAHLLLLLLSEDAITKILESVSCAILKKQSNLLFGAKAWIFHPFSNNSSCVKWHTYYVVCQWCKDGLIS